MIVLYNESIYEERKNINSIEYVDKIYKNMKF